MNEVEKKKELIERILNKFDKLQKKRQDNAEQSINPVPLSKADNP